MHPVVVVLQEERGQERARVEHDGQAQGRIVDPEEQGADGDVARAGDREELGHPLQRAEGQRGAEADGDGFGGAPFLAGCPPKSAMRMDSNRFADECRALTESWIESTWFFTLVVAVTCAVVGFGTMKLIRKQEKAKSGPGRTESDVTDLRSSFGGRKSNQATDLR